MNNIGGGIKAFRVVAGGRQGYSVPVLDLMATNGGDWSSEFGTVDSRGWVQGGRGGGNVEQGGGAELVFLLEEEAAATAAEVFIVTVTESATAIVSLAASIAL